MTRARRSTEIYPDLPALLDAHGLTGATERPLEHTGFSGARLTRLTAPEGAAFVLKRMSFAADWIMEATQDAVCREAAIAAVFTARGIVLPPGVRTPAIGVARDRDGWAVLMHDITPTMLPAGPITETQLDRVLDAMAALHRMRLPEPPFPWCDTGMRLTLLTRRGAAIAAAHAAPVARDFIAGWELFSRLAPPTVAALIAELGEDPAPLTRALSRLPASFLHGDLKLDNIGIGTEGDVWLIDWAMTLAAPPAVELGWFLAVNSRRLPASLDDVMQRYATAADLNAAELDTHDALTALCGLLLRGWRKALDADEGEPAELRWWCERAEVARAYL